MEIVEVPTGDTSDGVEASERFGVGRLLLLLRLAAPHLHAYR
jgi:hypothetical protein